MIVFKQNIDNIEEFNYLYDAVLWGAYSKEITRKALEHNIYSVSAYDGNKIVGYGRIIGDGIVFLYIHDIMVLPEYQNNHIGSKIMTKLIDYIKKVKEKNPDLRVYLGASKDREGFYKKFGFISRKDYGLGEGMILKDDFDGV